jgi:CheY-like chemotaxis protein
VFNAEPRLLQRIAPHIQRVLILDPNPQSVRMLSDVLRAITLCQVQSAATNSRALQIARTFDPQIIFTEYGAPGLDGLAFTLALRRSDASCRTAPVVMATAEATAQAILAARDAGVHEFIRKPYTTKDIVRRLEAVTLKHRDWVEAVQYVGPDRRRFNSGDYAGPRKRRSDNGAPPTDQDRLLQCLKIIRAAGNALDSDWSQARRALMAQALGLQKLGMNSDRHRLLDAGAVLQRAVLPEGPPDKPLIGAAIRSALTFLPAEEKAA